MKQKIIIFGGTFDPFTEAHYQIVKELHKGYDNIQEIVIAPTITNWYRKDTDKWLSDDERKACIYTAINKLAREDNIVDVRLWSNDIDKRENTPAQFRDMFTAHWHFIDTLMDIIQTYDARHIYDDQGYDYYFIIGSDQLAFFKNWYRWEDILKLAKMIVINGRNGEVVKSDIPHDDIMIPAEYANVSATAIRNQYKDAKRGVDIYLKKTFSEPEREMVDLRTPIFNVVTKPAPFEDQPDFHPVGINSKDWVTVICKKGNDLLCVRQLRYGLMQEFDEFPCGMIEEGEDPIDAAARELAEETGYKVDKSDLKDLGFYAANPAFMNNHMHYYFVDFNTVETKSVQLKPDEHERLTVSWKDKNDFVQSFESDHGSVFMGCAIWKLRENSLI